MAIEEGAKPGVPDQPAERVVAGQQATAERLRPTVTADAEPPARTAQQPAAPRTAAQP